MSSLCPPPRGSTRSSRFHSCLVLLLPLVLAACGGDGDDGTTADTTPAADTGGAADTAVPDAVTDALAPDDTAADLGPDLAPDVVPDVVPDVAPDVTPDIPGPPPDTDEAPFEETRTYVVGVRGAVVALGDGMTLVIPPEALPIDTRVTVSVRPPSDDDRLDGLAVAGGVYRIDPNPHGFHASSWLTVPFAGPPDHVVAYELGDHEPWALPTWQGDGTLTAVLVPETQKIILPPWEGIGGAATSCLGQPPCVDPPPRCEGDVVVDPQPTCQGTCTTVDATIPCDALTHATASCAGDACVISSCDPGWEDDDGAWESGCERWVGLECLSDEACADGDPCTRDACGELTFCVHVPLPPTTWTGTFFGDGGLGDEQLCQLWDERSGDHVWGLQFLGSPTELSFEAACGGSYDVAGRMADVLYLASGEALSIELALDGRFDPATGQLTAELVGALDPAGDGDPTPLAGTLEGTLVGGEGFEGTWSLEMGAWEGAAGPALWVVDCDGPWVAWRPCSGGDAGCGVEVACSDAADDEGDGRVDCADPDCSGALRSLEGACANSIDWPLYRATDPADWDACLPVDWPPPPDRAGEDYVVDRLCVEGGPESLGYECASAVHALLVCAVEGPDACWETCGRDAGCLVDCADYCASLLADIGDTCPREFDCADGRDADADGRVDCDDPDCYVAPDCDPPPPCGNGAVDEGEDCDPNGDGPALFAGLTCADLAGFVGGELACTDACAFDTSGCEPWEPCDDLDCAFRPRAHCDGDAAVVHYDVGVCDPETVTCVFQEFRTPCPDGESCRDGRCVPDVPECTPQTVATDCTDAPPIDWCYDEWRAYQFLRPGICGVDGRCQYGPTVVWCSGDGLECRAGACVAPDTPAECGVGLGCPPVEPDCADARTRRTYAGACIHHLSCRYLVTEVPCEGDLVCVAGACVEPACTIDDDCVAPAPACDEDGLALLGYEARCDAGACVSDAVVLDDCGAQDLICRDGACVATECVVPGDCTTPPPGTCDGATPLTYVGPPSCVAGACDWGEPQAQTPCGVDEECRDGACVPVVVEDCGDGVAEGDEACDPGATAGPDDDDLRGETCAGLGFSAGALACAADCTFDTTGCGGVPDCRGVEGDGVADCGDPLCAGWPACCPGCDDRDVCTADTCVGGVCDNVPLLVGEWVGAATGAIGGRPIAGSELFLTIDCEGGGVVGGTITVEGSIIVSGVTATGTLTGGLAGTYDGATETLTAAVVGLDGSGPARLSLDPPFDTLGPLDATGTLTGGLADDAGYRLEGLQALEAGWEGEVFGPTGTLLTTGEGDWWAVLACIPGHGGCRAERFCEDGVDDDANGVTDCDDGACRDLATCDGRREVCDNDNDDDGDGLVDCADPGCAGVAGCCAEDADCPDDGDECTADVCEAGLCAHPAHTDCCHDVEDCPPAPAGDCRTPICDYVAMKQGGAVPGVDYRICQVTLDHAACDDGVDCTTDSCYCESGGGGAKAGCVLEDWDESDPWTCAHTANHGMCADDDPCTIDTCDLLDGCVHAPRPGCCDDDGDCAEPTPFCDVALGECVSIRPPERCANGIDDDGDGDVDCDDTDCVGDDACAGGGCVGWQVCFNACMTAGGLPDTCAADCELANPGGQALAAALSFCLFGLCPSDPPGCWVEGAENCRLDVEGCGPLLADACTTPGDAVGQCLEEMQACASPVIETGCTTQGWPWPDNDGDGLPGCMDPDCFCAPACLELQTSCSDGRDNDSDGLTDCRDEVGCACPEDETCVDGPGGPVCQAESACTEDSFEPNDTPGFATPIGDVLAAPAPALGFCPLPDQPDDPDWFAFTVGPGDFFGTTVFLEEPATAEIGLWVDRDYVPVGDYTSAAITCPPADPDCPWRHALALGRPLNPGEYRLAIVGTAGAYAFDWVLVAPD